MNYQQEMFERYYSTHYKFFEPKTEEEWNWVIDRIDLNFGDIFSNFPQDNLVLDMGCGIGYLEYYLLKKGFIRIHAIDYSPEQLQIARERLSKFGLKYEDKVRFEKADVFEYLRKNDGYNVVVMLDLLDHFAKDKIIELLKLLRNALLDNGLIIIRVTNADNPMFPYFFYRDFTHETPFTSDSIRQCLNLSGFEVLRVDYEMMPVPKGKYFGILRRFMYLIRRLGFKLIAKFLGMKSTAFTEDIIVVGKK